MKSSGHLRLIGKRKWRVVFLPTTTRCLNWILIITLEIIWTDNYAKPSQKFLMARRCLNIIKEKRKDELNEDVLLTEDRMTINELLTSAGYFYRRTFIKPEF